MGYERTGKILLFAMIFLIYNIWFISICPDLIGKVALAVWVLLTMIGAGYFYVKESKVKKNEKK